MEEESGKGVYQSEGMKPEEGKSVESTDRGLFDFMKKKEDDQMASEFENKVHVSSEAGEDHHKKKHEGLVEKIHRSDGSSSSSVSPIYNNPLCLPSPICITKEKGPSYF